MEKARKQALMDNQTRYLGRACSRGHGQKVGQQLVCERYVSNGGCVECQTVKTGRKVGRPAFKEKQQELLAQGGASSAEEAREAKLDWYRDPHSVTGITYLNEQLALAAKLLS